MTSFATEEAALLGAGPCLLMQQHGCHEPEPGSELRCGVVVEWDVVGAWCWPGACRPRSSSDSAKGEAEAAILHTRPCTTSSRPSLSDRATQVPYPLCASLCSCTPPKRSETLAHHTLLPLARPSFLRSPLLITLCGHPQHRFCAICVTQSQPGHAHPARADRLAGC